MPNRLRDARSPYLRAAAHQPIHWWSWGEAAFEEARRLDKPVLLDVGAAWCHWCHVMDHESYESAEVARLVNDLFVAVKVDRDERPDVDARYQRLVGAITGQGGWPLTAFLTPSGEVFFGGTYFPPRDMHGRPGFPRILQAVAEAYRDRRGEVEAQASRLAEALRAHAAQRRASATGALGEALLAEAEARLVAEFDPANGGFGSAPKFPHPGAMGFLLRRLSRAPERADLRGVVVATLEGMGNGGVYDHVGGGFHRYSVDAEWIVPHFEKMLYDNAELLRNYAHAYALLGEEAFARKAEDVVRFMDSVLADRARGGWGGSQDADVGPHDDGDYFTWTLDELKDAVPDEARARALAHRFGVSERGEMRHDPRRNVLHVAAEPDAIAAAMRLPVADVERLLREGLEDLAAARAKRPTPFVDPTLYVSWNGMAASAVLDYAGALGRPEARESALRAIDRLVAEAYVDGRGFEHVPGSGVRGLLDDNAQMLAALVAAFDATGEPDYAALARDVADLLLAEFWSEREGDFLDVAPGLAERAAGAPVAIPERALHDNPSPSPAGVASLALLKLGRTLGVEAYVAAARRAVEGAAGEAAGSGVFGGALLLAADALVHEGAHVLAAADGEAGRAFRSAVLAAYDPARTFTLVDPRAPPAGAPPEAGALLASRAPPVAVVCVGARCLPPVGDAEALRARLREALPG